MSDCNICQLRPIRRRGHLPLLCSYHLLHQAFFAVPVFVDEVTFLIASDDGGGESPLPVMPTACAGAAMQAIKWMFA